MDFRKWSRPQGGPRRDGFAMTEDDFKRIGLDYLSKRIATASHLRKVLARRVQRARLDEEGAARAQEAIGAAIEALSRSGLLDDGLYARARGATLARKGASRRMVVEHLAGRGVDRDLARERAKELDDGVQALLYARRRRLGPFRASERGARRDRDVAALARAGFPVEVAIAAIDGTGEMPDDSGHPTYPPGNHG